MKHFALPFRALVVLGVALALSRGARAAQAIAGVAENLDFETVDAHGMPSDWGGAGKGYERSVDGDIFHGGHKSGHIKSSGAPLEQRDFATFANELDLDAVKGQRVRFSGYLRTQDIDEGWAGLWMRVDGAEEPLAFDNMGNRPVRGTTDWTRYEIVLDVSDEAQGVVFGVLIAGAGELWVDDLAFERMPKSVPATSVQRKTEPGLFEMRGEYQLTRAEGDEQSQELPVDELKLLLPLPLSYREQVPLSYELRARPADKLVSARVIEDRPGNFVAEVVLGHLGDSDTVDLRWSSIVLCAPRSFDDVPEHAELPASWPDEVRPWLASTLCVEAANERIRSVAAEIRGKSDDVPEIIKATLARVEKIYAGQSGRCSDLGAVQALDKQGSCTSRANLVAALLRANGIPARILAGYPLWSGALQTHYIVEASVPGYGWYPIESTLLKAPWPPCEQLAVSIVPPEYEDKSFARPCGAPGVPYLSVTEYVDEHNSFEVRSAIDGKPACDHVATALQAFPAEALQADWNLALERGRARWAAWLASFPTATNGSGAVATPLAKQALEGITDLAALARTLAQ